MSWIYLPDDFDLKMIKQFMYKYQEQGEDLEGKSKENNVAEKHRGS